MFRTASPRRDTGWTKVIKESIHQLVEELPEEELSTALRFLQYLKNVGDAEPVRTVDPNSYDYDDDYDEEPPDEEGEGLSVADAWRQYLNSRTRP